MSFASLQHRGGGPAETKGLQWRVDVRQVGKTAQQHNTANAINIRFCELPATGLAIWRRAAGERRLLEKRNTLANPALEKYDWKVILFKSRSWFMAFGSYSVASLFEMTRFFKM